MKDKILLCCIILLYSIIKNRDTYYSIIYLSIISKTIYKLIMFYIRHKFPIKTILRMLLKYLYIIFLSYILIKDPNPLYHILFFYLPFQNLFRGVFIFIFISYFNNKNIEHSAYILINKKEKEKEMILNKKKDAENIKSNIKDNNNNNKIESNDINFFMKNWIFYLLNNKLLLLKIIICLVIIKILIYFYDLKLYINILPKSFILPNINDNTKFYIAANLFNNEKIIKDWISEMKKLINYLGPSKVYFSIFENGDSTDKTAKYLREFENYLNSYNISNKIITTKTIYKGNKERIVFLAELRNRAMDYLYEITKKENIKFDDIKVLFFNDIIFTYQDVIRVLSTNKGDFDVACGMDYYESFYDIWVSITIDGEDFRNHYPFTINKEAQDIYVNQEVLRVFSCWNGLAIFKAKPFENHNVYFRALTNDTESECTLLMTDFYHLGFQKVLINTKVVFAYEYVYYFRQRYLYPWSKNLATYWYYYFKFGFRPRNKKMSNLKDNKLPLDFDIMKYYFKNFTQTNKTF